SSGSPRASWFPTGVVGALPTSTLSLHDALPIWTAQEGQTLTANPGTWSGSPAPTYAYQWQRCGSGGSGCADIVGATASSYALVRIGGGPVGRAATATTSSPGSASATSSPTGVVS